MHPKRHARSQQRRTARQIRRTDAYAFFNLLTDEATLDQVESLLPIHRERLLPPTETLAMFMAQTLNADRSCQNAINEFSARRVASGLRACSTSTAAYCRARKRLPQHMVFLAGPFHRADDDVIGTAGMDVARSTSSLGRWHDGGDG